MNEVEAQPANGDAVFAAAVPGAGFTNRVGILRDGSVVKIRPLRMRDADLERAFTGALSPGARRYRFFGQMPHTGAAVMRRPAGIAPPDDVDMVFAARSVPGGRERDIGISRYSAGPGGQSCECTVAVPDQWRNRGMAAVLMRHLIEVARERGIGTMVSIDLSRDDDMRDLAQCLGFQRRPHPHSAALVIHTLDFQGVSRPWVLSLIEPVD